MKKISALFIMILMGTSVLGASLCGVDCPSMAKEIKQDVSSSEMPCHESKEDQNNHKENSNCSSGCCFSIDSEKTTVVSIEAERSSKEKKLFVVFKSVQTRVLTIKNEKLLVSPPYFRQISKQNTYSLNQQFLI